MRPASIFARPWFLLAVLAVMLVLLAMARPLDHDESQYVAAAVLAQTGVPYRDFAYLQTPLQPLLFAPLAWLFGAFTWPGLRIVNALLGAVAVACVYRAAREGGAGERSALLASALFACTDIFLFSVGTARNDALPVALMAAALPLVIRAANDRGTRNTALLAGLFLAGAGAAKISYALPAIAYGIYALTDPRHRPVWVVVGAAPMALLVAATAIASPDGFLFGVLQFPAEAPGEYYRAIGKAWKLGYGTKLLDVLKFLALGPALIALLLATRFRWRVRSARAIDWMMIAAIIAVLAPSPTWRQYLLPVLPLLFLRLAIGWHAAWPGAKTRVALAVFAAAGLAPSVEAVIRAAPGVPMIEAMTQGRAVGTALDMAGVTGRVVSLSPQFLPAAGRLPDARFATGPFYFRSKGLLTLNQEIADRVVSRDTYGIHFRAPPAAILVGGEGKWTSGDDTLEAPLERWARDNRYRHVPVGGGRFRLYVRPR